jgi:hypothetical protein
MEEIMKSEQSGYAKVVCKNKLSPMRYLFSIEIVCYLLSFTMIMVPVQR